MALTAITVRAAKATDKPLKLSDEKGLFLEVRPGGGKWWRLRYRHAGREKMLSLGVYPEVSLADARERRDEARRLLASGIDPSAARKAERAAQAGAETFEAIAREWFETRREGWSAGYADKVIRRLELDVFPRIGNEPISAISPPALLAVLRRIEARGVVETAHRALESCSQVFRFAIASGRAQSDPGRDLKGVLRQPEPVHFPAITRPDRLAELLRAIDGYRGTYVVRAALQLMPMLLVRPGELRFAEWSEIDLEGAVWTIPAKRMKRPKRGKLHGEPHIVPLAVQAVAVLRDLHSVTGRGALVFPGGRGPDRPMSDNTVNAALRTLGFPADEVTGHGFRATARTLLQERLGIDGDVIEAQLAHTVRGSLGRAYNRTEFQAQRVTMMQTWADYLQRLRMGGHVVELASRTA